VLSLIAAILARFFAPAAPTATAAADDKDDELVDYTGF